MNVVKDIEWTDEYGVLCTYTGEVDQNGNVCGSGVAISVENPNQKYELTSFDGRAHGICKSFFLYIYLKNVQLYTQTVGMVQDVDMRMK